MEQLDYNLLFRWFVGLSMDDAVWDATVFCKNRDRLLNGDIARKFMSPMPPMGPYVFGVGRQLRRNVPAVPGGRMFDQTGGRYRGGAWPRHNQGE